MRRLGLAALALAVLPLLTGFTHFSETNNVCPSCAIPSSDVVVLKGGMRVPCEIVAENQDYYVLKWHSEYRAADRTEVASIEWRDGKARTLAPSDQLRDTSGIVYQGKIVESNERFISLDGDGNRHTIWKPYIRDAHQAGQRLTR